MTLTNTKLADGIATLWQMAGPFRSLSERDMVKLTAREVHDHGLCNKARLHYECHGRDLAGTTTASAVDTLVTHQLTRAHPALVSEGVVLNDKPAHL